MTFLNQTWKEQDKSESRIEKIYKDKSEAYFTKMSIQLMESKDPQEQELARSEIMKEVVKDKHKYARMAGMKALKLADDLQDDALAYEVIKDLGINPSLKTIQDQRKSVYGSVASKIMTQAQGTVLLKQLDSFSEGIKNDPNYVKNKKAAEDYLAVRYAVADFERGLDIDGKSSKAFLVARSHLSMGMANNPKENPISIAKKYLGENAPMVKDITGFPANLYIEEDTLRNLDTEQDYQDQEADYRSQLSEGRLPLKDFENKMKALFQKREAFKQRNETKQRIDDLLDFEKASPQIPFRR